MEINKSQEEAIHTINGPVLLISCPGSGKTTTMLRRIQYMIEQGIKDDSIIMVTFTEAAATEMKTRFVKAYGSYNVTFCTIHSLCLKIISAEQKQLRIIPANEQYRFVYEAARSARIPINTAIKDVLADISAFKNGNCDIKSFRPSFLTSAEFVSVYQNYEERKEIAQYMDFDDLLMVCKNRLESDRKLLMDCRNRYRYIMCDEYQDTNYIQKEILYLLSGENGNLCVVGDDDQSIYGFRGANPRIMLDFKKDFPHVHEIHMDTNYRSQPEIIQTARCLIEHNSERFEKDITTAKNGSGKVIYKNLSERKNEIDFLCNEVKKLIRDGILPSSIAVLARTNQQLDDIAAAFEREQILYSSNDSIKDVYEHFVFSDLVAYLRLINGTGKLTDLIQILNKPSRYLKESDFRNLNSFSKHSIQTLKRTDTKMDFQKIDPAIKLYDEIVSLSSLSLSEQVRGIIEKIDYRSYLSSYAKKMDMNEEFLVEKLEYFKTESERFSTLDAWVSAANHHIMLHKKLLQQKINGGVVLSTMHRSKGLEWDCVFIIDCCKGSVPIAKAESKEEIEEERRLFYVAITRAKEMLYILSYHNKPGRKNTMTPVKPSIFIEEMNDTELLKIKKVKKDLIKEREKNIKQISSEFLEGEAKYFKAGMEVHHATYGVGIVISKTMFFASIQFACGVKIFTI